jgi:PAS domain S-box-containing protein
MSGAREALRGVYVSGAYVATYVALDWVSYIHPLGPFAITPWNPPPGLSLALLLAFGLRFTPALFVAALAAEIIVRGLPTGFGYAVLSSAVLTAGYGGLAWLLVRSLAMDVRLRSVRDVALLVSAVAGVTIVVAASYVGIYVQAGAIAAGAFFDSVLQFWVGDAIGILVTAPVLLQWLSGRARWSRPTWEIAAQGLAVIAALLIVFGGNPAHAAKFFYVLFVPLIWIAVRHGVGGAASALLAMQVGIIVAVQIEGYASATLLEFQLFMLALAITGLVLGVVVSERGRARDALARREAELASVFLTAPDGIVVLDEAGRITDVNEAARSMFGIGAAPLAGIAVRDLIPALDIDAAPLHNLELAVRTAGGATLPVEVALGRARIGERKLYVCVLRDIADRKAIEGRLREQQIELDRTLRLAAAGETASALAHELNQPLSAIATYTRACTLLLERTDENRGRLTETMRKVVDEVARAGEVVRRLRDFFRSGTSRLERIAVARLLAGAVEPFAARLARHRVALEVQCAGGLPDVLVDRLQIETVLHNLIANGIDAIVAAEAAERRIAVRAAMDATGTVKITVADSGPGLPPEMKQRMFKPFTTTKPSGMGLGLAISRSIVESHGGRLEVERSERGAQFAFTLPVHELAESRA